MKKIILFICLLLIPINSMAINVSASSAILMDMDSKRILYGRDIHNVRSVASISKIMTAVLAVESGKLDDVVTIGDEIDGSYGSGIYIKKGETITLRDLLYGLMLRSGNDASLAIAYYVGGESFVEMMNNKAQEIGMLNTTFNNPNGLDETKGNYSSTYDMAILTSYAMNLMEYQEITATRVHTVHTNMNTYVWINKNKLLFSYEYITGGKTGYTDKAKRTLVTTASKDNMNLVAVTLNDGNDFKDHRDLFEYGFNNYKSYKLLQKGNINIYDDIYYGVYSLSLLKDYSYPLNETDEVIIKYELEENPKLGNVGIAKVIVNNNEVYRDLIYASEIEEEKEGFWDWIKNLW